MDTNLTARQLIILIDQLIDTGGNHGVLLNMRAMKGPFGGLEGAMKEIVSESKIVEEIKSQPTTLEQRWMAKPYPFIESGETLGSYIGQMARKWDPEEDEKVREPEILMEFLKGSGLGKKTYEDLTDKQKGLFRMGWDSFKRSLRNKRAQNS